MKKLLLLATLLVAGHEVVHGGQPHTTEAEEHLHAALHARRNRARPAT